MTGVQAKVFGGQQIQLEQSNITYRDQLLQQVSKTAAQEERNRLARDLHDSIKQQLFSIVVNAAAVRARWEHDPASARKIVDEIERTALEAQVEMQALLQQLRPSHWRTWAWSNRFVCNVKPWATVLGLRSLLSWVTSLLMNFCLLARRR